MRSPRPSASGPDITFSRAVRWGNRWNCWKTIPACSRTRRICSRLRRVRMPPVSRSPAISIVPAVGSSRKFTQRSRVDLPDPDRPKMTITSPRCSSRSTSRSTSWLPYALCSPDTRTRTSSPVIPHPLRARAPGRHPRIGADSRTYPVAILASSRLWKKREDRRQRPVEERHQHVGLEVLEVGLADQLAAPEHLGARHGDAEERHEGGVLHHRDELVAGRRDDHPHRLRQHHAAHLRRRTSCPARRRPRPGRGRPTGCRRGRSRSCRRRS